MKKYLVITVDTNDGDYNTSTTEVTDKVLTQLLPVFKAIKSFKTYKVNRPEKHISEWTHHHNWPYGECFREDLGEKRPQEIYELTEDQVELFEGFTQSGEYGFHTVKEIKVIEVIKEIKYL